MAVVKASTSDFFSLFDLPRQFSLDLALLDARYREVQAQVHPDKFAQAGDAQRRLSMQWATHANEAYQTLKKPLARAIYLLQLAGHDVGAESNTAMPASFLIEQMEWREQVMEARMTADLAALEALDTKLTADLALRYEQLGKSLDQQAWLSASEQVRCLMFLEKLRHDLADAIEELEE